MIVYGHKSIEIAKETLMDKCPNCGAQNSLDLHVFQKYVHLFWIPFLPAGKSGVSQCDKCHQILKSKEMPSDLKLAYYNIKSQTKTPIWMFSGAALMTLLIVGVILNEKKKTGKNAQLILTPHIGDIFEIKTKEKQYTLYKVAEVSGDSVFVQTSNFETNVSSGLTGLIAKGDTSFAEESIGYTKLELKKMVEDGEIQDIILK